MKPQAIEFNVGTVWSDSQLKRWSDLGSSSARVGAVFGSRRVQSVGHGRAPADVPEVTDTSIVEHARTARRHGIAFLYLLNGLCRHLDLEHADTKTRVLRDIEWVVEEVQPTSIVVADRRLGTLLRARYGPEVVGLRVSTIAGIRDASDLAPWLSLGIDGVVLHHDAGRDYERIRRVVNLLQAEAPDAEVELLVNESCVHQCFAREAHYARLALASVEYTEGFQQNCNIPRFLDPSLVIGARWIRPEDLGRYVDLGVRRFKIAGREMSGHWLDRAVASYLRGRHEGNLIELFTMTPPGLDTSASDIVRLDNRSLDGFLERSPSEPNLERQFLQTLAASLWEKGSLEVRDPGSRYEIVGERLRCTRPGRYLSRLQAQRVHSDPPFKRSRSGSEYEPSMVAQEAV